MQLRNTFIIFFLLLTGLLHGQTTSKPQILSIHEDTLATRNPHPEVSKTMHYSFDSDLLNKKRRNASFDLVLPTFSGSKKLVLKEVQLLSSAFKVTTSDGLDFTNGRHYKFYQGYVEGQKEASMVALTTFRNEISLLVTDNEGDFQVKKKSANHYEGYFSQDLRDQPAFECATDELKQEITNQPYSANRSSSSPNGCVDIYFEVDYAGYNSHNQNLTAVTDWVVNIFNNVALQFNRIGIEIRISEIMIHTSADPYTGATSATSALNNFAAVRSQSGFNGRLGHLLSTRSIGGGAAWVGALCGNNINYAVSGNLSRSTSNYPNYSWNVMVVAHELGHNFGSQHTQRCVWNGNNTAIDGCVDSEGSCPRPPAAAGGGTIMSYCHLNSVGINLSKGFGPQPSQRIYDYYANANCSLSADCSDVPPLNDICHTAINLPPNISCIEWSFDNINATPTTGLDPFSCGTSSDILDVWFTIPVPADGKVFVETSTISGGLSDMIIEVYTGDCFGLSLYTCDSDSGTGDQALIDINDISLGGTTIYVRVAEQGSDESGEFSICAYTLAQPCSEIVSKLRTFYTASNGASWTNKAGWEDTNDCDYCHWYGITCNYRGEIIAIDLSENNLSGTLNSAIDTLIYTQLLDLSGNSLGGAIPEAIGNMIALKSLKLNNNNLSQEAPDTLYYLRKIEYLDCSNNELSGSTPNYIGYLPKLEHFDFSNNQLSGCFEASLTNLCDATYCSLLGNEDLPFSGDHSQLCIDYTGVDFDGDGYCQNINDCNDNEAASFEGNPEICDGIDNDCNGIVDDGFENEVNEYISTSNQDWNIASNWSRNHVPLACEEVEIGLDNQSMEVDYSGFEANVKGIKIGPNATLNILEGSYLQLVSDAFIDNQGTFNINGSIYAYSGTDNVTYGLRNQGVVTINGNLGFGNQIGNIIQNLSTGHIYNYGSINLYQSVDDYLASCAILNQGHFISNKTISVFGVYSDAMVVLKPSSVFQVSFQEQWNRLTLRESY